MLAGSSNALKSWQGMDVTFLIHAYIPCEAVSSAAKRCCIPWACLHSSGLPALSSPAPVKQDHKSSAVLSGIPPGEPPLAAREPLRQHSAWARKHLLNEQMTNTFVSGASYSNSVQRRSLNTHGWEAIREGSRQIKLRKGSGGNSPAAQVLLSSLILN